MKTSSLPVYCVPFLSVFVVAACGDSNSSASVTVRDEAAGANCTYGGKAITANGTTEYVCNPSTTALTATTAEAAGTNCTYGGTKIAIGTDDNGDGALGDDEVDSTQYICSVDPQNLAHIGSVTISSVEDFDEVSGIVSFESGLSIELPTNTEAQEITFEYLEAIGSYFEIECGGQDLTLHFPKLTQLAGLYFSADCGKVTVDAPVLTRIGGQLRFDDLTMETLSAPELASVDSLSFKLPSGAAAREITFANLETIDGSIQFNCVGTDFTVHLPKIETVDRVYFNGSCGGSATIDSPALKTISSQIIFNASIDGTISAPLLTSIGGLAFYSFSGVVSISATQLSELPYISTYYSSLDCSYYDFYTQVLNRGITPDSYSYGTSINCADTASLCPFITVNDDATQFRACYSTATWSNAQTLCQGLGTGWDLAYFTSDEDFASLTASAFAKKQNHWIGYTDAAVEGTFAWVQNVVGNTYAPQTDDADPLFWTEGEPNDDGGEDCAEAYAGGLANDLPCSELEHPLCRLLP